MLHTLTYRKEKTTREECEKKTVQENREKPKSSGYGCQNHGQSGKEQRKAAETTRHKKHDPGQVRKLPVKRWLHQTVFKIIF